MKKHILHIVAGVTTFFTGWGLWACTVLAQTASPSTSLSFGDKLNAVTAGVLAGTAATVGVTPGTVAAAKAAADTANSIGDITKLFGQGLADLLTTILSWFMNWLLMIASWFLGVSGTLLNVTIQLTLHIKDFVNNTPAVFQVWTAIRDISGLFIIFFLLYAAIMLIIGIEDPHFGSLIKNIVLAGILINFSFFFTGILIDASNIVSTALYHAITPGKPTTEQLLANPKTPLSQEVLNIFSDGGLSNLVMQSLQITSLYDPKNISQDTTVTAPTTQTASTIAKAASAYSVPVKVVLIGSIGVVIMWMLTFSFLAASLAFIVRMVILIFLLAFSPIWMASYIVPNLKEYSSKWTKQLKSMLIFMPVYLLLMYAALSILNQSTLFNQANVSKLYTSTSFAVTDLITIAISAAIVIIMINIPLIAAVSIGGTGVAWADKMTKKLSGTVSGFIGRNTAGRAATAIDKRLGNTRLGNSVLGREFRSATIGKAAASKYGSTRSYGDLVKVEKEAATKSQEFKRRDAFNAALADQRPPIIGQPSAMAQAMKGMSEAEKLGLKVDQLTNPKVIQHLSKGDFEAIKKSADISDEDKKKIGDAREKTFKDAVTNKETDTIKNMMKNYEGTDLLKFKDLLADENVVRNLSTGQVRNIEENSTDDTLKKIAVQVLTMGNKGDMTPSFGWLAERNKNAQWVP